MLLARRRLLDSQDESIVLTQQYLVKNDAQTFRVLLMRRPTLCPRPERSERYCGWQSEPGVLSL